MSYFLTTGQAARIPRKRYLKSMAKSQDPKISIHGSKGIQIGTHGTVSFASPKQRKKLRFSDPPKSDDSKESESDNDSTDLYDERQKQV